MLLDVIADGAANQAAAAAAAAEFNAIKEKEDSLRLLKTWIEQRTEKMRRDAATHHGNPHRSGE